MIRSGPLSLMANYIKTKRVESMWSCITTAVEGNWTPEEGEDLEEIERRMGKVRRDAEERLDEDNALEGKTT